MISFVKQCEKKNKKPSVQEFFKLYGLKTCDEFCTLYKKKGGEKTRDGRKGSHVSCDWQSRFFFFKPSSNDFPVEWGEERPRKRDVLEKKETAPDNRIKELETQLASANEKLKDLHLRLKEAEQKIVVGEGLRKELHNNIMELKGNIRVFCRVRPLLTESCGAVSYPKSGKNIGRGVELMHNAQLYPFTFDKVFDQTASQEEVFTEISQLVQSAFDGYKVCIFAYGQTGSGKTHTMMGNPEVHDQKGLIPRAMEKIFQTSQIPISQGLKYKMQASMLEIYNETIRDLLAADNSSAQDGAPSKCKIRHDANGNTDVSGLTVVEVGSMNEVSSLLKLAAQSRSVAKTQMNEESSRSHFIFRLQIVAVNQGTDQQVQGVLNLIDLAGSERLNKSGAAGDRLEETKAINKSLSSLSHVISSIAKKADHIPFRNSKLTSLLEPCLGGDSKTLMFVNLSPEASSTDESICSLRFAASVNSCEIGIPRRQNQVRSSALKESAMNAEGKDLERAMKSCDDLARENDYLRARLKDNPDLTALNNQVQALEGDKNILKTKLNKAEGEVKLLLEENRALRRSKQEAGVLAGQEENIDLKESTPPAIPASQTLQGAQEVKAAVLTSCPELA